MSPEHDRFPPLPEPPAPPPEAREAAIAQAMRRFDAVHGAVVGAAQPPRSSPSRRLHVAAPRLRYVAAGCIAVLIAAPTAWLYLKDASPLHFKVSPSRETAPVSRMAEGMPPPQPAAPKIAVTEPTARPAASLRRDQSACTANDPDRKISGCTEIIEDHAQSPSDRAFAYLERGVALAGKGELDKAMSDFNEAIRLNPTLATAYFNRSLLRRAKGDLDGAKADRDQATRLDPGYGSR